MSSLIVNIKKIDKIKPHNNAEKLEIALIGGWQCVVPKDKHKAGQEVIYFPPDIVLPLEIVNQLGVTKYCQSTAQGYRIRQCRLRGQPSFGLVVDKPDFIKSSEDILEYYKPQKFIPPIKVVQGDSEPDHPLFPKYTDIENLRNFPSVIKNSQQVNISEKIHGSNCKVGFVDGEFMAGSHRLRRKNPGQNKWKENRYWYPLSVKSVYSLITYFGETHKQAILYGEIYGRQIQGKFNYGELQGVSFAAFDLMVDGKYLNHDTFAAYCKEFHIPMVPFLAQIPYEGIESIKQYAQGGSQLGGDHIKEGVVIRPLEEIHSSELNGRLILKYISDDYLLGQAHMENDTTDY